VTEKIRIQCNACGADMFQPLSTVGEWEIGRCRRCSLIYVNPAPFFEPSNEFSDISVDFQYTQYMRQPITPAILEFERQQLRHQVGLLKRFSANMPAQGRLLEVGCGSGASVRAAVDLGWDAIGIDIDPVLIQLGREQLKVDVRATTLLKAGLDEASLDFIRLRDVIEHLPNPYETLLEIKRLLAPNGVALIVTPNEGGLPTQVRLLLGKKRDKVATVPPPHHLHGFTPDTLRRIFDRVGLRTHVITTTPPFDPDYVTSNNMRSADRRLLTWIWSGARLLGRGSVLVGWVTKN